MSSKGNSAIRKKDTLGVALEKSALVAVELEGVEGNTRPVLKSCKSTSFSGDLTDRAGLKSALRTLGLRSKTVALSLPDTVARTSILEFEELPANAQEAGEVIKWKAAKGVFLKPSECSIDFQMLPSATGKKAFTVVVERGIVEAQEDAFMDSGMSVEWIGINSLNAFNAFVPKLGATKNFIFITLWDGSFVFSAFKNGVMDFYRLKEVSDTEELLSETATSFAFYAGQNPDEGERKIFILGADGVGGEFKAGLAEVATGQFEFVDAASALSRTEGVSTSGATELLALSAAGSLITPNGGGNSE